MQAQFDVNNYVIYSKLQLIVNINNASKNSNVIKQFQFKNFGILNICENNKISLQTKINSAVLKRQIVRKQHLI